jgi:translocation and assembly module TamB
MATVANELRRRGEIRPRDASQLPTRRRWVRRAIALLVPVALVWAAPTIVAKGPWRNSVLGWALSDLRGTATVGSCSLGWFSPVKASDIEIRGADDQMLLSAPSLSSDKSLLSLLLNLHDLGGFDCEQPKLNVILRDDGSNVEDALAAWLQPNDKPPTRTPALSLTIHDGQVALTDAAAPNTAAPNTAEQTQWQVEALHVALALPRDAGQPLELEAEASLPQPEIRGHFTLKFKFIPPAAADGAAADSAGSPDAAPTGAGSGELALDAAAFPLALCQAIVRRALPGSELAGSLDARLAAQWGPDNDGAPQAVVDGQLTAANFLLAGPWLNDDRLRLARLDVPLKLARQGSRLRVDRCELVCDAGTISCQGAIDQLDRVTQSSGLSACASAAAHAIGEVKGQIDLARLAAILPRTLRIREGTRIESGQINLQLASRPQGEHWAATGRIETTRLVAVDQGRQIAWEHPLAIAVDARDSSQGPVVERLDGQSDFLRFQGAGTLDRFEMTASYDLARLADELGRFVDLGELRLAGTGQSRVSFQRDDKGQFEASGELQAENFELARPGTPPWIEQRLSVTAAAAGLLEDRQPRRVDRAQLRIESGLDQLTATLRESVADPTAQSRWPLALRLQGQIARWLRRVEPWIGSPGEWQLDGQADLDAQAICSADEVEIQPAQLDVERLHAWGNGLFVDEPRVQLRGAARWTRKDGRLELKDAVVASSALSAQAQEAVVVMGEAVSLDRVGNVALRADLARLQTWFRGPREPAGLQLAGRCEGKLQVADAQGTASATLDAVINDLVATPKSGQPWRERQVRITGEAAYDSAGDSLQLTHFVVASDVLKVDASGQIARVSHEREARLTGKLDYDLEQITKILQPFVGEGVQLTGRESRTFELTGPLASATPAAADVAASKAAAAQPAAAIGVAANRPVDENAWLMRLSGRAGLGWKTADIYGFPLGQGDLEARLADGMLRISPLDLAVSEGRVKLAPSVRLSPLPAELYLPAGPLAEQVHITPEMCSRGLMYVAPVLAGVTQAQGSFSIAMDGCRLPLADFAAGDAAGKLTVHSVEIGPGPLVEELAVLMGRAAPAKLKRESQVEFRLVQGRVYHRGLELVFPEFTVRTYGSVGLDKTLAIMAEMPVPPKWIGNNPLGNALKDQTIQLPIAGTLSQPKIDRQVLDKLAAQFIRKTGEGLLRNELNRQLDRLLPKVP